MKARPSISLVRVSGGHWILPIRSDLDSAIRSMALRSPASFTSRFSRRRARPLQVEIEAAFVLHLVRCTQCLNYLRVTGLRPCLLLHFGPPRLEITRVVRAP